MPPYSGGRQIRNVSKETPPTERGTVSFMTKLPEWKYVRGSSDRYEVNEYGEVWRLGRPLFTDRTGMIHRATPARQVKPQRGYSGFLRIEFWVDGVKSRRSLADVVGEAFHGPIDSSTHQYVLISAEPADNYVASNITLRKRPLRAAAVKAAEKYGITL